MIRDAQNRITDILPIGSKEGTTEAPIYFEIDRQSDPTVMEELCEHLQRVLNDVELSVIDWRKMLDRAEEYAVRPGRTQIPNAVVLSEPTDSPKRARWPPFLGRTPT